MTIMTPALKKACGGIAAALLGIFAAKTLLPSFVFDPADLGWLLHNRDPSQAFLGQVSFLNQPWSFPPGLNTLYNSPFGTSIVYTDSIPLWSLLLKAFHANPGQQYFGFWLLLCFALNGLCSFLAFSKLNRETISSLGLSAFAILSPFLLWRFHEGTFHLTLLAHFPVWLAFALLLPLRAPGTPLTKRETVLWSSLFVLGLGTHFYLFLMQAFLFLIRISEFRGKQIRENLSSFLITGGVIVLGAFTFGYFAIPLQNTIAGGFGRLSMNLLAPFLNFHLGLFLPSMGPVDPDQREGYCYLGLGLLILFILTLVMRKSELREKWKQVLDTRPRAIYLFAIWITLCLSMRLWILDLRLPAILTYVIYCSALAFLSIRLFRMRWYQGFLLAVLIEGSLLAVSGLFRSSGRLSWLLFDLLLVSLATLRTQWRWVLPMLLIQCMDLNPLLQEIYTRISQTQAIQGRCEINESVMAKAERMKISGVDLEPLTDCVFRFFLDRKPVGLLYTARDTVSTDKASLIYKEEVLQNQLTPHSLYIFPDEKMTTDKIPQGLENGPLSGKIRWMSAP